MPIPVATAKRRIIVATAMLWLVVVTFAGRIAHADEEADIRKQISSSVKAAWDAEDFKKLESTMDEYIDPSQRTLSGKRRLSVFHDALKSVVYIEYPTEWIQFNPGTSNGLWAPYPRYFGEAIQRWDVLEARLKRWAAKYPDSPNPALAMATYNVNRAWYFRGDAFAKDVPSESWPLFRQSIDAAERVLLKSRAASARNPLWFDLMFTVYGVRSPEPTVAERKNLLADLLEHGQSYPPAYQAAIHFLEPRWGGSPEQMEAFARLANDRTLNEERGTMYARLHWNLEAAYRYGSEYFRKTGASWPMLKASFQRLVDQYPVPKNLVAFAKFSCMAKDIEGAKALLKRAGPEGDLSRWSSELRERCATR